jgi:hypothetical protein
MKIPGDIRPKQMMAAMGMTEEKKIEENILFSHRASAVMNGTTG